MCRGTSSADTDVEMRVGDLPFLFPSLCLSIIVSTEDLLFLYSIMKVGIYSEVGQKEHGGRYRERER